MTLRTREKGDEEGGNQRSDKGRGEKKMMSRLQRGEHANNSSANMQNSSRLPLFIVLL